MKPVSKRCVETDRSLHLLARYAIEKDPSLTGKTPETLFHFSSDQITRTKNATIDSYSYTILFNFLADIVNDGSADPELKNEFVPVLAARLAEKTEEFHIFCEPIEDKKLVQVMKLVKLARKEGWLSPESREAMNRLMYDTVERYKAQYREPCGSLDKCAPPLLFPDCVDDKIEVVRGHAKLKQYSANCL